MIASGRGRARAPRSTSALKAALRPALELLPDRGRALRHLRWRLYLAYWNRTHAWRRSAEPARADPCRIYWIATRRIQYLTERPDAYHLMADRGRVLGGDWDVAATRFESRLVYQAIRERIDNGARWQDTPFYARGLARIAAGGSYRHCRSQQELDQRCAVIDQLILSMREHGYRLGGDVELKGEDKNPLQKDEEIFCNIDRHGRYLFHEGQHRLAIAKVLGISHVPVKILLRHRHWQTLRNELCCLAQQEKGSLYQPPAHPDLQDIPAYHACEDRFEAIRGHVSERSGTLLDLGAHLGYFCHRFEELGYQGIAVESHPLIARLAERIRIAEDRRFRIIFDDLLHFGKSVVSDFDVMLALNIFHHFLKSEESYMNLQTLLRGLAGRVGIVFFEPHHSGETQTRDAFRNYNEEEFVAFVKDNLGMLKSKYIHQAKDKRRIFALYND